MISGCLYSSGSDLDADFQPRTVCLCPARRIGDEQCVLSVHRLCVLEAFRSDHPIEGEDGKEVGRKISSHTKMQETGR